MSENPQDPTALRHPIKRARGLGSAKDGTGHFIAQRISSVALLFLSIYVIGLVIALVGADYVAVRATVAHPLHATLLIAFTVAMFWHTKLGFQVVIEDYVHTPFWAVTLHLLNLFVCALAAIAGVLAIVRIALGA
jgi:succinate dehydrogenase / fumarate reductase, membrane anchor subunit